MAGDDRQLGHKKLAIPERIGNTSVHAQHELKNLNGRSVRLDIHAEDDNNTRMNVEIQRDKPIYPIERYICIDGEYISVGDGSHTVYVNGAKQGSETELEKLMHDFHCTKADDMYFPQLAKKMRFFKEEKKD